MRQLCVYTRSIVGGMFIFGFCIRFARCVLGLDDVFIATQSLDRNQCFVMTARVDRFKFAFHLICAVVYGFGLSSFVDSVWAGLDKCCLSDIHLHIAYASHFSAFRQR